MARLTQVRFFKDESGVARSATGEQKKPRKPKGRFSGLKVQGESHLPRLRTSSGPANRRGKGKPIIGEGEIHTIIVVRLGGGCKSNAFGFFVAAPGALRTAARRQRERERISGPATSVDLSVRRLGRPPGLNVHRALYRGPQVLLNNSVETHRPHRPERMLKIVFVIKLNGIGQNLPGSGRSAMWECSNRRDGRSLPKKPCTTLGHCQNLHSPRIRPPGAKLYQRWKIKQPFYCIFFLRRRLGRPGTEPWPQAWGNVVAPIRRGRERARPRDAVAGPDSAGSGDPRRALGDRRRSLVGRPRFGGVGRPAPSARGRETRAERDHPRQRGDPNARRPEGA
jgi:hypothetical protein